MWHLWNWNSLSTDCAAILFNLIKTAKCGSTRWVTKCSILGSSSIARGARAPPHWPEKYAKSHVFSAFEADFCSKNENSLKGFGDEVVKELPWFGRKNRLNFRFRPKNPSLFRWRPFFLFLFLEITCFWAEKPFQFPISAEKSVSILDYPFESDSKAMKIRVQVAYSCLTLSKKPPSFPSPGYAPAWAKRKRSDCGKPTRLHNLRAIGWIAFLIYSVEFASWLLLFRRLIYLTWDVIVWSSCVTVVVLLKLNWWGRWRRNGLSVNGSVSSDGHQFVAVLGSKECVSIAVNRLDWAACERLPWLIYYANLLNLRLGCCYFVAWFTSTCDVIGWSSVWMRQKS